MRRSLTLLSYKALTVLGFPLLLLYLAIRVFKNRAYLRGLGERFGNLPPEFRQTGPGAIWLHAVSVGEIIVALPLIDEIRRHLPGVKIFLSTATLAGRSMAAEKAARRVDGIFYAPLDLGWVVRRVLRILRPALVVVMETEIWPNLFRETRASGAQLLIVNGRISDKALPRYRRFGWFFRSVLPYASTVLAQDESAAARYRELGAENVEPTGNLKYDFEPSRAAVAAEIEAFLADLKPEEVWIAASTMPPAAAEDPDEDVVVLDAFEALRQSHKRLLMILVPRRPERFDFAARLMEQRGIPYVRRSVLGQTPKLELPGVLLLDTIGELSGLFARADVVFMGGTLVHRGGHNILEPAAFGKPIVTGPHMENFAEIAASFRNADAVETVHEASALAPAIERLLSDPEWRRSIGARALEQANARRGATAKAAEHIVELYEAATPRSPGLNPLAWLWRASVRIDRAITPTKKLDAAVISVGNLAMGGTGKTPLVIWLIEKLTLAGLRPAVLTRGYGRTSRKPLALPAGTRAPVAETGEEPQIILRSGLAPVGIARNRARIAEQMIQDIHPDVFVLDDGFQHWRLARDLDIVLIDSLDPWRNGLPPAGRLREDSSALSRADAVVLTRTHPHRKYSGLIKQIRAANPHVPIFRARVETDQPPFAPGEKIGAFCGLAQPETFRSTLLSLGCEPVFFKVFPDHHKYSEVELTAMAAAAPKLVTTEKDLLNVPEKLRGVLPVTSLKVRIAVEDGDRLAAMVLDAIQRRTSVLTSRNPEG